jgi:hypothetical protein
MICEFFRCKCRVCHESSSEYGFPSSEHGAAQRPLPNVPLAGIFAIVVTKEDQLEKPNDRGEHARTGAMPAQIERLNLNFLPLQLIRNFILQWLGSKELG